MKCMNCNKEFQEKTVIQRYCSEKCKREYYRKHPEGITYPSITFRCSQCGHLVVTDGKKDKRTRFCCESCERKFWKHPHWENETSRTNFHSVQEYLSWERRTNEEE